MKKVFSLFLLFLALALGGCSLLPQTPATQPNEETAPAAEEDQGVETSLPETTEINNDEELIKAAFASRHPDWNLTEMDFVIEQNTGEFVTGSVGPKGGGPGGGMFFAAKQDGEWVVAWDGNGTIGCQDIQPYNFPASMIPECFDEASGQSVKR